MWSNQLLNPCCWFGYGSCDTGAGEANGANPNATANNSTDEAEVAAESCRCQDSWPFRVLVTGNFETAFDVDTIIHTAFAAGIGALIASFFLYLVWRQYLPRVTASHLRSRRATVDSSTMTDDYDTHPGDGRNDKHRMQKTLGKYSSIDFMPDRDLVKEAYTSVQSELQPQRFIARRFEFDNGVLRADAVDDRTKSIQRNFEPFQLSPSQRANPRQYTPFTQPMFRDTTYTRNHNDNHAEFEQTALSGHTFAARKAEEKEVIHQIVRAVNGDEVRTGLNKPLLF